MMRPTLGELIAALILAAFAVAPFLMSSQAWLGFAINTMLISVLGIAWNITGGFGGQMSFGHAPLQRSSRVLRWAASSARCRSATACAVRTSRW
jgi:hypothetical protein